MALFTPEALYGMEVGVYRMLLSECFRVLCPSTVSWKGIELGSILRAAFCTHPLPYHIRHSMELSCIEVEMLGSSRKSQK